MVAAPPWRLTLCTLGSGLITECPKATAVTTEEVAAAGQDGPAAGGTAGAADSESSAGARSRPEAPAETAAKGDEPGRSPPEPGAEPGDPLDVLVSGGTVPGGGSAPSTQTDSPARDTSKGRVIRARTALGKARGRRSAVTGTGSGQAGTPRAGSGRRRRPRTNAPGGPADLRPAGDRGDSASGPAGSRPAAGTAAAQGNARQGSPEDDRDTGARAAAGKGNAAGAIRRAIVAGKIISEHAGDEEDTTELPAAGPDPATVPPDDEVILSGLVVARKPAAGQVALAGSGADDLESAGPAVDVPDVVIRAVATAIAWAYRRGIGLSSACGIWIALAVCAATWFSAGTRTGNLRGVAAMWAGYLVLVAGQHLARGSGGAMADAEAMAEPGDGLMAAASGRRATTADRRAAGPVGWLAALGSGLAESVVYVGLALGAVAGNWPDGWTLAIAVLGLCAVRNLMTACSTPPGFGAVPDGLLSRVTSAIVTMPPGGRVLMVGIVAPVWGARAALLALVDWSIISIGFGIAGRARAATNGDRPDGQASALVRLRDDGALARGLGSLVRGGLLPLPPAVLGLAAVAALALAGRHGPAGALTIGAAIVMLLAAPGSGHPHTGRFDWLVPVILLGAQALYLSATGFAAGVPAPVVFALLAALLLWYADLASPGRPILLTKPRHVGDQPAERGTWLGWEGRLLLAGLGAAVGIATFAYLALTAYLGVLICAKVVTSCLAPREEDRS
jgi:hypothetical protein